MAKQKLLVVIDGKSVLYRGYYAMGDLATSTGKPTGATYGFALMGLRVLKEFNPDYVVVAWDKSKTNIRARRKLYSEYKANRKPMPEDLREQIPDVQRLCEAFGWPLLEIDDFEADDIMGTLAVQAKQKNIDSILVTSDLDVLQLVNHHTRVCALKRGLTRTVMYDEATFKSEYNMTPGEFIDYKALRGDPSDNIPGVKGIGEKTARQLIIDYGSLEIIYNHLDDIGGSIASRLTDDKKMAFLSRDLVRLSLEVPVRFDDVAANAHETNPVAIKQLFRELNFRSLQRELPKQMVTAEPTLFDRSQTAVDSSGLQEVAVHEITSEPELDKILGKEMIFYSVLTDNRETQLPDIKQVILASKRDAAYSLDDKELLAKLPAKLKGEKLIGFNLHNDLRAWGPFVNTKYFDIIISGFLLNPLDRIDTLAETIQDELPASGSVPELQTENTSFTKETVRTVAAALWQLYDDRSAKLKSHSQLLSLAENIEFPFLNVVALMERRGVKLDTGYLARMSSDFNHKIENLQQDIYSQAGQDFNLNSPPQLQMILFEKLQLPTTGIKRTKTGYSTGASELAKLRNLHPIIDLMGRYRELSKLKSTYIDALPKLVDQNNRLHTTFTQTVAQTGRLSSLQPNLQNIPVRTDEGKAIRTAFITETNNVLVQADYSQFELRLAAALSGDQNMIDAFNRGADIHTQTAAEVYNVKPGEVTKQQRYNAKAVNFGVMYGMSPHGLSIATGMARDEAKAFIDRYFEIRNGLLRYLEGLKQKAKTDGYVETLFGRRRPMPDIHSSNFAVRAAAERAAMNMPIQGTEADLMKMAMIRIDDQLDDDCWQILQIHDSILVECPQKKAESVMKMLKNTMETIYKLPVKLDVETSTGKNWGEL